MKPAARCPNPGPPNHSVLNDSTGIRKDRTHYEVLFIRIRTRLRSYSLDRALECSGWKGIQFQKDVAAGADQREFSLVHTHLCRHAILPDNFGKSLTGVQ